MIVKLDRTHFPWVLDFANAKLIVVALFARTIDWAYVTRSSSFIGPLSTDDDGTFPFTFASVTVAALKCWTPGPSLLIVGRTWCLWEYDEKYTGLFPPLVHGLEHHLAVLDLFLETLALLGMVDDSLEVLVALLELVHHTFVLVGGGTNCVWVALAALV